MVSNEKIERAKRNFETRYGHASHPNLVMETLNGHLRIAHSEGHVSADYDCTGLRIVRYAEDIR